MTRPASRGFTLVELLVAIIVSSLVIAAALALMTAQQRVFRSGTDERQIQEGGRVALDELATNLRMAGFGIDPALAFDFGPLVNANQGRAPAGTVVTTTGFKCPAGQEVVCRDRIDGSDEIVFRSRDPVFGHRFTKAIAGDVITIDGPIGADLQAGQVLQIACYSTPMTWAYVTVAKTVVADPAAAEVAIQLVGGNGSVFPLQNDFVTAGTCFGAVAPPGAAASTIDSAAKVFKVDTYRYYVDTIAGRPYLMLDQGFAEPVVVAPDVEDLQFVYLFPNAPVGDRTRGEIAGERLSNDAAGLDLAPADGVPSYYSVSGSPERINHHPGNIRAVRVSAVVRAPTSAPDLAQTTMPAAGNRKAMAAASYRRFVIETSAPTRNLDDRAPYFPAWSAGVDAKGTPLDALNKGGG